jgi:hypothetical protein
VLCRVTRHASLWHTWVLRRRLLLLKVLLVVESGLGSHVSCGHAIVRWHPTRLAGRDLGVAVLGGIDRAIVDAVCVVGRRLGRVQTGLGRISSRCNGDQAWCAHLNKIFSLRLRDKRLQLGGGECVDKTGLRDDEKQHLGASEDGQLVGLDAGSARKGDWGCCFSCDAGKQRVDALRHG